MRADRIDRRDEKNGKRRHSLTPKSLFRFRLLHLVIVIVASGIFGIALHCGVFDFAIASTVFRSSPFLLACVQIGFVVIGLIIASELSLEAERSHWPEMVSSMVLTICAILFLPAIILCLMAFTSPSPLLLWELSALTAVSLLFCLFVQTVVSMLRKKEPFRIRKVRFGRRNPDGSFPIPAPAPNAAAGPARIRGQDMRVVPLRGQAYPKSFG